MCWKILILILLSSCATQEPSLVDNNGGKYFGYAEGLSNEYKSPHTYQSSVIVKPGLSLRKVASENRVDIGDVMAINAIYDENFIFNEETRVYLPNYIIHRISVGDTIHKLSRFYSVPAVTIVQANQLAKPNQLEVGQELKVYILRKSHMSKNLASNVKDRKEPETPEVTVPPQAPIKKNNDVAKINPAKIKVEQDKKTSKPMQDKVDKKLSKPIKEEQVKPVKQQTKVEKNKATISQKPATTIPKKGFMWPVKGKILHPFGEIEKGIKNEGINILTKMHSPVHASEDGEVVFSGNEIPGFGNLIIIKHKNNWYSSYGHQHDNAVSVGEKVKKGDVIAYAGKSGNVGDAQLFFSLQRNKKPVDPVKYLSMK